jgi:hypothetical protein
MAASLNGSFMKVTSVVALVVAFLVTFFTVGVPYWQLPYSRISLPNSLYGFGLWVVFALAAVLRLYFTDSLIWAFSVVGGAVPALVLVRVGVEVFKDPTSHNLWPLEFIIAAFIGFSVALAGALLGRLLALVWKKVIT